MGFQKSLFGLVTLSALALAIPRPQSTTPSYNSSLVPAPSGTSGLPSIPSCAPDAPSGLSSSCWQALNMTQYLQDWLAANGTAANCGTLGFAQCFLQWNGYTGLTCNIITSETCSPFDTADTIYESQQQFYALWNIYSIHQYIGQFSIALSNGQSLAAGHIGEIVLAVDPPKSATVKHGILAIFLNLSVGLFGLASNAFGPEAVLAKVVFLGVMQFAAQSGSVTNYLNPSKASNNYLQETIQMTELSAQLSTVVNDFQNNLGDFVEGVEGNLTEFLVLAETGGFSQRLGISLADQSSSLYDDLKLYVLNLAIQANSIFIAKTPGVDPRVIATQTSQMSCPSLDQNGVCSQFYFDANTTSTYALSSNSDTKNLYTSILQPAFANGWATPGRLFVDAEGCQGADPSIDAEDIAIKCASNNLICTYATDGSNNNANQFIDCPNQPSWGTIDDYGEACVPVSYLGPLLTSGHICYGTGN